MSETGVTRNMTTLRVLSLAMGVLALTGWGSFAYAAKSSATAQQRLSEQVAELKISQGQALAERDQARAEAADLKTSHDQLITERDELKAQLAVTQQEVAVLTKKLEDLQAKASVTGSIRAPSGKPPRSSAQTKKTRR
jgi:septal ring factor EnvC (AmiA/AmiB activator)